MVNGMAGTVKTKYTAGELRDLLSNVTLLIDGEKMQADLTIMQPVRAMLYWCEMGAAGAIECQKVLQDHVEAYEDALARAPNDELAKGLQNTIDRLRAAMWSLQDLREQIDFSKPFIRIENRPGLRGRIDKKLLEWRQDGWRLQIVTGWIVWLLLMATEIAFNLQK